ncbi:transposase [Hyella patelloides LEGE 07179]|uniref:Transposase n=1 Tax=Hyella patelloides LEGE 07179 TaxID=945734 RepID=A0A563VKI6_9CYAN|nr:IS4 family transposase [Hyella patelloides]VEP11921.1 transposase [Hyella patelloides LEGE 07179]
MANANNEMAHSQKSIRDHARNRTHPNVDNEAISRQLEQLLKPCVYNQLSYYRSLGMRERILGLPLMLAAVLTLVWRQVPSARELNRMLARENLLWAKVTKVSQQALSQRLLTFPASMFERVLTDLLVTLNQKWHQRKKRTLPLSVNYANQHFERLWIVDASTLEALFRKLKSLENSNLGQLAGRICAVVDLETRYPVQTWFDERPYAHESNFVPNLLELVTPKTLLLLDRGFWHYRLFEQLILAQSDFITRLKSNAKYESISILSQSSTHRDTLVRLGTGYQGNPILALRLVEIRHGNNWYRYLTSVLHPDVLPPYVVGDLYSRRWRIEESFLKLKRLLGLSYLWTGSINGIKLQLWATWLFYVILIDLSDEVADELSLPMNSISVEMVFRGIYHFTQALNQGNVTGIVSYLTAPENHDLGVVKSSRPKRAKPPLDLSPSPS